ncbi:hypothetical protein ONE63_002873 [Megalurothrips usitatus]|uniref:Uncharacterized protein n=1 Tax=Megalurothrips usitatus TaxID=439358 RepID=A0AAV7X9T2_9NEOP|nr:hypothetical protein ONE63_002873 [Megalurothrips usitatus]
MPFTLRTVQPVFVSRTRLADADGKPRVRDDELEAVFNNTLCNAIRQLASLVAAADDVFGGLNVELRSITDRAAALNDRLLRVRDVVEAHDPRVVPVREYLPSVKQAVTEHAHTGGQGAAHVAHPGALWSDMTSGADPRGGGQYPPLGP